MSYLTLNDLTAPKNRRFEDLEVPELGGKIRLAELPAGRSLEFKHLQGQKEKGGDVERKQMIALLVGAIVDEQGKAMLNEKTANQFIEAVSFKTLQLIVNKVLEMIAPPPGESTVEGKVELPSGN